MREFEIPTRTYSLNRIQRAHWAAANAWAEIQKRDTFYAWRGALGKWIPELPCAVTMTRVAPSNGLDEHDNLPASLKYVADTIAGILGVDDRDKRVSWDYDQEAATVRGYYSVKVRIEETEA